MFDLYVHEHVFSSDKEKKTMLINKLRIYMNIFFLLNIELNVILHICYLVYFC